MHIAVIIYGRLWKCVEHYNNIIENLGENNHLDFFCFIRQFAQTSLA